MDAAERVIVIGAGQAGLAVSHELTALGIAHTVIERGKVGETWRRRWDSFCLVTPNWTVKLPGMEYAGPDPDGYLSRDDLVAYFERYASSFAAPVREGVEVQRLASTNGRMRLDTSAGSLSAEVVVVATGTYRRPHRPGVAADLPGSVAVIDAEEYTSPTAMPPGAVLLVGSGQTGCQLAEELQESGREVFMACGKAPWIPRRWGGVDAITWLHRAGFFEVRPDELPSPVARLLANPQASGHGGGRDLHYRTLQRIGVTLTGRLAGADGRFAYFGDDLASSVAWGDVKHDEYRGLVREYCARSGVPLPDMPDPESFKADPPGKLELARLGSVVFTSGFRPDYASWIQPDAFDDLGFPLQRDGASTVVAGLYFVGTHFLRKRKSSLLMGVSEDAAIVAGAVAAQVARSRVPGSPG